MRTLKWLSLAAAIACPLLLSMPVGAETFRMNGNFCSARLADTGKLDRSSTLGVLNSSTSTATVECPFRFPLSSAKVNSVSVTINNRHANVSFTCTLFGLTAEGGVFWSSTVGTSVTGVSTLSFFTNPTVTVNQMNMQCVIPGAVSGSQSYVASYISNTTP